MQKTEGKKNLKTITQIVSKETDLLNTEQFKHIQEHKTKYTLG